MPSFEQPGARTGYALRNLAPRVAKLADILRLQEPAWLGMAVKQVAESGMLMVSIGGGPGFDHAALRLVDAWWAATSATSPAPRPSPALSAPLLTFVLDF